MLIKMTRIDFEKIDGDAVQDPQPTFETWAAADDRLRDVAKALQDGDTVTINYVVRYDDDGCEYRGSFTVRWWHRDKTNLLGKHIRHFLQVLGGFKNPRANCREWYRAQLASIEEKNPGAKARCRLWLETYEIGETA